MSHYNKILCAINLGSNSTKIIRTALAMADNDHSRLHVIHTCEHPITGYGEITGSNHQITEAQIRQGAYPEFCKILENLNIPKSRGQILFGPTAESVEKMAAELKCDLIVVGGHGKTPFLRIFGSTSISVLEKVNCDVLTVKIEG